MKPSIAFLSSVISYEPATGQLFWRERLFPPSIGNKRFNKLFANKEAGTITKKGYRAININKTVISVHQIIWAFETGYWSAKEIDHKNMIKLDNKFSNLREATAFENQRNRKKTKLNTSGYKGVYWCKVSNKWLAQIKVNNCRISLGYFHVLEQAAAAYDEACLRLHGRFARPNSLSEGLSHA